MAGGWSPIWATVDAGNMRAFPMRREPDEAYGEHPYVLDGIQSLGIWADRDRSETGQNAAETCAARWRAFGREVAVLLPPDIGRDWNDLVRAS